MDDVIVPGASYQESLFRMEHDIFDRLLSPGFKLIPSKCISLQTCEVFGA